MDFEQQVAVALRTTAQRVSPPVEQLVRGGAARGQALRRRRSRSAVAFGGAIGAAAVLIVALASGLGRDSASTPPAAQPTSSSAPTACPSVVRTDVLPEWAWAGFSDPRAGGVPYVLSNNGGLVAVLFGNPLSAPEAKDHSNKILWVARDGGGPDPLEIQAERLGSTVSVHRTLVVGPSYLLLPSPGCWHLSLTWGGGAHHDTMDLAYVAPAG